MGATAILILSTEDYAKIREKYHSNDIMYLCKDSNIYSEIRAVNKLSLDTVKVDLDKISKSAHVSAINVTDEIVNELQAKIDDSDNVVSDYFVGYRNTLYLNAFSPLLSLLEALEVACAEHNIRTLILFGGHPDVDYLVATGGEGEGPKYFYRSRYFFNRYVYEQFNGKLEIKWTKKDNRLKLSLLSKLRLFLLPFYQVLAVLLQFCNEKIIWHSVKYEYDLNRYRQIFCFRIPAQLNNAKFLIQNLTKAGFPYLVLYYNNLKNYDLYKDIKNTIGNIDNYASLLNFMTLKTFALNLLKSIAMFLKIMSTKLRGKYEAYNLDIIKMQLMIMYVSRVMYFVSLDHFLRKTHAKTFISLEAISIDGYLENLAAKKNGLNTIAVQVFEMDILDYPDLYYADSVFVFDKALLAKCNVLLCSRGKEMIVTAPFIYYREEKDIKKLKKGGRLRKVLFASSDEPYHQVSLSVLDCLVKLQKEMGFNLEIKLHPRNRMREYLKYRSGNVNVYKNCDIKDLMKHADIFISLVSSTIYDAMFMEVPSVVYLNKSRNVQNCNMSSLEGVTKVFSLDDLSASIKNYQDVWNRFYNRKTNYITDIYGMSLKDSYRQFLSRL